MDSRRRDCAVRWVHVGKDGPVRFSFCAKSAEYTLAPHASVTLHGEILEGAGFTEAGRARPSVNFQPLRPVPEAKRKRPSQSCRPIGERNSTGSSRQSTGCLRGILEIWRRTRRESRCCRGSDWQRRRKAAETLASVAPDATWARGARLSRRSCGGGESRQDIRAAVGISGISTIRRDRCSSPTRTPSYSPSCSNRRGAARSRPRDSRAHQPRSHARRDRPRSGADGEGKCGIGGE